MFIEYQNLIIQILLLHYVLCSTVDNFSENVKRKLVIGYNNSLRFLLGLPRWNSASNMFVNYNVFSFEEVMRKYVFSMIIRISNSENCILKSLWNYDIHLNSHIFNRWNKLLFKYVN